MSMSLATKFLATMSLAAIVPRDKFYNRLKQKKSIIIQIRDLHCLLRLVSICFCIWICQVESWGLTIEHTQGPPPPRPPPLAPQNHHCAFAFNIKSTLYRAHYIHHYDFSMPCPRKSNISILCNCCCSKIFTLSRFLDPSQTWVHLSSIGEKHPK